jgi:hypothetical protein
MTWFMQKRMHQIDLFKKFPMEVQREVLSNLLYQARFTAIGEQYHFHSIKSPQQFAERVPIFTYESIQPLIDRIMKGEQNLLWHSDIRWFAKSSGTTNDRSKFIPVTYEGLEDCHFKGGKDLLAIYCSLYPDTKIFTGKGLTLGGSHQLSQSDSDAFYGDLSAVLMQNLPYWAEFIRTPDLRVALMSDWEDKLRAMVKETMNENVTNISGVPTWTLLLIQWMLQFTRSTNIHQVWPNLEVYFHGGVSFKPYRRIFQSFCDPNKIRFLETYNASEGFFGIQDQKDSDEMLLMLDYGIYFEFIAMSDFENGVQRTVTLEDVSLGVPYAMLITTNGGLWRYLIGDTIVFTSNAPFRFRIVGRTRHFINAFGEELMVENADIAIEEASTATGASVADYTAAPVFMEEGKSGCHEWAIEFHKSPDSLERFINILDESLRRVNSDYDAKRYRDIALKRPKVNIVPAGTFYFWLKTKGKLGGQNKVPRLSNERQFLEQVLQCAYQNFHSTNATH